MEAKIIEIEEERKNTRDTLNALYSLRRSRVRRDPDWYKFGEEY